MITAMDIMTPDVITIQGVAKITTAVKLMEEKNVNTLIIERRHNHDAYGIITRTDIVNKVIAFGLDPQKVRVYEIMTKPCIVINPDLGLEYIARLFKNTGIKAAPVIQDKLMGIISEDDLLRKSEFLLQPQSKIFEEKIAKAVQYAKALCIQENSDIQDCIKAWQQVEALEEEAAFQQGTKLEKTALEEYCEENPQLMDSFLLENWCSG
jgi:predicted transcriptional regulator